MMLNVLMDGIRDAGMMLDYAEEAYNADRVECGNWFKTHARKRIDALDSDFDYVSEQIGLEEKAKAGDEIALSLRNHISGQLDDLQRRFASL